MTAVEVANHGYLLADNRPMTRAEGREMEARIEKILAAKRARNG